MHKRHILPKEEDRRWPHHRDPMQRNYYPHKPIMAFPPYHSSHALAMPPIYPMWGQPGGHPASVQMWQTPPPNYNPWQPTESWHWKPYTGVIFPILKNSNKLNHFSGFCYKMHLVVGD